jgi:hypothetical protein
LINGDPAYPDAAYVVLSVVERRMAEVAAFRWDPGIRDFGAVEWEKRDD